jgi:hypothetical protein
VQVGQFRLDVCDDWATAAACVPEALGMTQMASPAKSESVGFVPVGNGMTSRRSGTLGSVRRAVSSSRRAASVGRLGTRV